MTDDVQQAATEAAQRVVEEVSSWEYSAERDTIAERLDQGLRDAKLAVDDDERSRILAEINEMKDEESGPPQVRSARPAD